jgi:predicted acetyltransferase
VVSAEKKKFSVNCVQSDEDLEGFLGLMRTVFGGNVDVMVEKWVRYHPRMTFEDFFVAKHGCRVVAGLCLIPQEWSIGGVSFNVVELGCVATEKEYRNRGLQRRLMLKFHERVQRQGFDLSVIEGIPFFYRQFGYEYALPLDESISVRLDKVNVKEGNETIRLYESKDLPVDMQLLKKAQRKFFVTSIRDEAVWKMQMETCMMGDQRFKEYCVEKDHSVIACFRTGMNEEAKELYLKEITNVDESAANTVLKFLKQLGLQHNLETLVCTISSREPFSRHLFALGLAQKTKPYAWQIQINDYLTVLQKMRPLFERRLKLSPYRTVTACLKLSFYKFSVEFKIEKGCIKEIDSIENGAAVAARFNPTVFPQLLLGYRSLKEMESTYPDILVKAEWRQLFATLFPKKTSFIHTVY